MREGEQDGRGEEEEEGRLEGRRREEAGQTSYY
jgi:hypothetical protein